MSTRKPAIGQSRPSFVSRTAFELLAPSSDEDNEIEDEEQQGEEESRERSVVIKACVRCAG